MTTPTNACQTSERERLAEYCDAEAEAFSAMEYLGERRSSIASKFTGLAALLRADEAEIEALQASVAALRAENEALRTVTDEDLEAACAASWNRGITTWHASWEESKADFMELTDTYRENIAAILQSFIRSKESSRG